VTENDRVDQAFVQAKDRLRVFLAAGVRTNEELYMWALSCAMTASIVFRALDKTRPEKYPQMKCAWDAIWTDSEKIGNQMKTKGDLR